MLCYLNLLCYLCFSCYSFSSGNRINAWLIKVGNVKGLHLIVRGHIGCNLAALYLGQVSCAIVERFEVWTYNIAQVRNHSLCKLGKLACAFLQMVNSHFSTNGKDFGVYADVHLSTQLLAHTFTEFCVTLISNKAVAAWVGLCGRCLLLALAVKFTCLNLVFKSYTHSLQYILHTIERVTENV